MPEYYDIFNGDADGICALHQLRLAEPRPGARLVTGVKRDIRLLRKPTPGKGAELTVLDISLASNRHDLEQLLAGGCRVLYIDHHFPGEIPQSSRLTAHIDPKPETCTGLIVDRLLAGRYRDWAVTAAFGDNLHEAARRAAGGLALSDKKIEELRVLGELLNYNGYGFSLADLHFHPADLYRAVSDFVDPFAFLRESEIPGRLRQGYEADMRRATAVEPLRDDTAGRIHRLPAEPWARRIIGVFSNKMARERPAAAHAMLIPNEDATFRVSVRAPLTSREGADRLCRKFPTGGGREAAAGINSLPPEKLDEFLTAFARFFNDTA